MNANNFSVQNQGTSMTYDKEYGLLIDFIEKGVSRELTNDQKDLRIVSEGDLQSCAYYHLRKFFKKKKFTKNMNAI